MTENIEELLEQSAESDLEVALAAKENAKRAVLEEPSAANLAAFERASKILESAAQGKSNLKDYRAVLAYAEENMRKLGRSKLFEDIKKGRIKRQPDGSFKARDADRYLATLPFSGASDPVCERAADRQRRKEEEEIRRIKAVADKEEFDLAVKKGRFVPKENVHLELAARAVALSSGLKTSFEARCLDIVEAVGGNPRKAGALTEILETVLDEAFNEYSREMEFEILFELPSSEPAGDNGHAKTSCSKDEKKD